MPAGRKPIEIDLAEVERLAGEGHTEEGIAANLGIGISTLKRRKHDSELFEQAIKTGKEKAHTTVSNQLFTQCKKGNIAAIIWYEKTRRGMSDSVDIGGKKDNPLNLQVTPIDYRAAIAPLAPGPMDDSDPPGEDQGFEYGPPVGQNGARGNGLASNGRSGG